MAAVGSGISVVLGGQWGDEGKGKLVDILAQDADIVARCQVYATIVVIVTPISLLVIAHLC